MIIYEIIAIQQIPPSDSTLKLHSNDLKPVILFSAQRGVRRRRPPSNGRLGCVRSATREPLGRASHKLSLAHPRPQPITGCLISTSSANRNAKCWRRQEVTSRTPCEQAWIATHAAAAAKKEAGLYVTSGSWGCLH